VSAQHTPDASVISWDINERVLTDGSPTFDVVGTSDEGRVTFHCVDERAAVAVCDMLNSSLIVGAVAEKLHNGAMPAEKTCTRCNESWPADTEFFRAQSKPRQPNRLAPWCRACEADQKAAARAITRAAIAKANGSST
jgi:hypothetical protein